uniref:Elongator complex protein 6 n=1 Tax=Parascaris univalens TaxID=6257 RepID=A0A915C987_PARUN
MAIHRSLQKKFRMISELSSLIESVPYDVISVVSEGGSSPCFLLLHFVSEAIKRNARAVLLTTMRSERAYRIIASKAMVRLNTNVRFVSLNEFLTDELVADDTLLLNRLREAILREVGDEDDEAFMLFDNLSLLSDVLKNASSVIPFLRQLQISVRAKGIHPKLILTLQSMCDVSTVIMHKSDFVLKIKLIGSGFAKDVTGQLTTIAQADREVASITIMHYHLGDRSVHVFSPGLVIPNL